MALDRSCAEPSAHALPTKSASHGCVRDIVRSERGLTTEVGVPDGDSALRAHQPVLVRVGDELCTAESLKLLLKMRPMRLNRPGGEVELTSDLGIRLADRKQAQDVHLSLRQTSIPT